MKHTLIAASSISFLKELDKNNNREWFNSNKQRYLMANENLAAFADELIHEMNKHDVLENASGKKSLYRIYNDVRFSKDKQPYNPRLAFGLSRATKYRRGGYYMNIKPGNCYLACGFFSPNVADLQRIRKDIEVNYMDWNKILNKKQLKDHFGPIRGSQVLTAPRGYSKDHPAIDLLRQKQFIWRHDFADKEVLADDFLQKSNKLFKSIRPLFDYMSDVLTTNANGQLIV